MGPHLALCLTCLGLCVRGLERASLRRSDQGGRCLYSFIVESPAEASCPMAKESSSEVEYVKNRLALLETLVSRLVWDGAEEKKRSQLQKDKESLERQLEETREEVQRLRAKSCGSHMLSHRVSTSKHPNESAATWQRGGGSHQELKAEVIKVSVPEKTNPDSSGCGELLFIGEPRTHRKADGISGKYGFWFQDPEPAAPYGAGTVWRLDVVGSDMRQLLVYENLVQLERGFPNKVLRLPEGVESTGATVYRGSLYYQRARSRTLLRYNLAVESVAARRELPHAGFHGQYPYTWGGYTDIDLAVDEKGLWAIYSTSKASGSIVVSQLEPHTLQVKQSWDTGIRRGAVANGFMLCGRLYTVESYSAPNTTINHTFDTATGHSRAIGIPFLNKYLHNSMVDYNHANRKLYAWDNFHMVTYDVKLGKA